MNSNPEKMSSGPWNRDEQEQEEWEHINKLLKQHGLRPVCIDNPGDNRNLIDMTVMDRQSSQAARHALKTLVEETERQRKIVRGLIEDNHQLRDELRLERSRASRQEQRANSQDIILENIKHKIRQLEDESIANASLQHNQVKDLQMDHQAVKAKYNQQSEKLREQEETITRLEKELSRVGMEEQQRVATQKKMFHHFCKLAPRTPLDNQYHFDGKVNSVPCTLVSSHTCHMSMEISEDTQRWLPRVGYDRLLSKICCLIDYYESQISQVRKELRKYKKKTNHAQEEKKDEEDFLKDIDATANYKALLMSFQTQIIETKARNDQLLHENINLKKEMEIRPTAEELKFYKHQVKKLEKTVKNIKLHRTNKDDDMKENRKVKSNIGEDQLQEVSRKYLKVLSSIDSIVRSPKRAPFVTHMQRSRLPRSRTKEAEQECGFEHLPFTVEMWADQLMALKNLYQSLKKLFIQLVPWLTVAMQENKEHVRVEDLQLLVDEISEEVENEEKKNHVPSQQTLYAIICHFQKLFDVNSLNGIYPRMNEVYTKLGEMTNAMRNLRDLLELDASAPPSVLVNTVGKLCSLFNENVTWQVGQLLRTQDIESIFYKLEECDEFFPAFQALIEDLLHVLEVRNLTDILPAVQKLKWKAHL